MKKNTFCVDVTRPTQILVIMRGIPGSVEIKESLIHGKGVFATSEIVKGTIFEFDVIPVNKKDISENLIFYSFPFNKDSCCLCFGFISFVNHSKNSNLKILSLDKKKLLKKFIVTNNVKIGDELFLNYGNNSFLN